MAFLGQRPKMFEIEECYFCPEFISFGSEKALGPGKPAILYEGLIDGFQWEPCCLDCATWLLVWDCNVRRQDTGALL